MTHAHTTDCSCGSHGDVKPSRAQEVQAVRDRIREVTRTVDGLKAKVAALPAKRAVTRDAAAKAVVDRSDLIATDTAAARKGRQDAERVNAAAERNPLKNFNETARNAWKGKQ